VAQEGRITVLIAQRPSLSEEVVNDHRPRFSIETL